MAGGIAVLGSSGFLGGHLASIAVALAQERGIDATLVLHERPPAPASLGARVDQRAARAELEGELEELLDERRPGIVLNAIALASLATCEAEPDRARCLNTDLPERLARWSARSGAKLVHVSTDLVFEGRPPRRTGYRETDEARPRSVYGASKLRGEERVLALDPIALVVRLPLLFGPSGARPRGASELLLAAIRSGERPSLFVDEHRTPLAVEEAARALFELAERGESGLWHVAGPQRLSRAELGLIVLRAAGFGEEAARGAFDSVLRAQAGMDDRPADCSLDGTRARELLATELSAPADALARRA